MWLCGCFILWLSQPLLNPVSRHNLRGPHSPKRRRCPKTPCRKSEPINEWFTSSSSVSAASAVASSPAPSSSKFRRPRFLFEEYGADCKHEEAEEVKGEDWEQVKWEWEESVASGQKAHSQNHCLFASVSLVPTWRVRRTYAVGPIHHVITPNIPSINLLTLNPKP